MKVQIYWSNLAII